MASYTAGPYTSSILRITATSGIAHPTNVVVLTLDTVNIPYTLKPTDLQPNGALSSHGAVSIANAVNATTTSDPTYKQPIGKVFLAKPSPPPAAGAYSAPWVAIQPHPQFRSSITLSAHLAKTTLSNPQPLTFTVTTVPSTQSLTIVGPIAPGAVLTTTVDGIPIPYHVTASDNEASIATNIAAAINAATTAIPNTTLPLNQAVHATASAGVVTIQTQPKHTAFTLSTALATSPQTPTLTVQGRFLHDRQGNPVILRGVDLPLLDNWAFPGSDYLSEVAQTGANALRVQWYVNYGDPDRPAYTAADLGSFLDRCIAAHIIPIVMLSDLTCQSDPTAVNSQLIPWWTSAEVVAVLQPRANCLILNLANELGFYRWADDSAAALSTYVSAYTTAIASMRSAGYTLPLMIDAPDCGTTLDAFTSIGAQLVAADPLHNLLLSTHAYWAAYDGAPFVTPAVQANLPIVFGEIANKQDETVNGATVYGYYDLDGSNQNHPTTTGYTYQGFLQTLLANQIGWLAWTWHPDSCDPRNMSSDGTFAALSPYGQDIVHNPTYGLKATATRITP